MSRRRHRIPGKTSRTLGILFLVASPDTPGLTVAERLALTLRRDATISGRCACGAKRPTVRINPPELVQVELVHADDCPAADGPHLERLRNRLGDQLEWDTVLVQVKAAA